MPCVTVRRQLSMNQKADPHQIPNLLEILSWTSPFPELCNKIMLFISIQHVVFYIAPQKG